MKILGWLRAFLAALSLAAISAVFVLPSSAVCVYAGWLPRVQLVPALMACEIAVMIALAVLVALFGRLYCSVICPLGIAQDASRFVFKFLKLKPIHIWNPLRWTFLTLFCAAIAFGYTGLIEPYGIFGRFLSTAVMRFGGPSVAVVVWAASLFAVIVLMSAFRARWWCNQICPVGTFLGIFSRFSFFHVRIDMAKCVNCNLCVKVCDKGCISSGKDKQVDASKCVMCLNCAGVCKKEALKWR